jgi:hypothetical protein
MIHLFQHPVQVQRPVSRNLLIPDDSKTYLPENTFAIYQVKNGEAYEKQFEYMRLAADTSDMTAHGLFVSAEHGVYGECMSNYMNCEYYPKELIGVQRLLTPFSAYEKGEIDAELLVHACYYITLDTEKDYTGIGWYTAETLKKAGIII